MAKSLAIDVSLVALIVILLAFYTTAASVGRYEFAKFILQWPKSSCNTGVPGQDCRTPILDHFIIGGFWPMHFGDIPMMSYQNGGCGDPKDVVSPRRITRRLLATILRPMNIYWPYIRVFDLNYHTIDDKNVELWRVEWIDHGGCYAHPQRPDLYFDMAITLATKYADEMLADLIEDDYGPSAHGQIYAYSIALVANKLVNKTVQIRCNENSEHELQLHEIAICLDTNDDTIDCEEAFIGCARNDLIKFPAV